MSRTGRTPRGQAFTDVVIAVFRLHGQLVESGDALAAPSGQTTGRWQVLGSIDVVPDTVAGIARRMGLTRQSVQRTADLLAGEGCAHYIDNPAHRRAKLLAITPRGLRALREIEARQSQWANAIAAHVRSDALVNAAQTLDALRELLSTPS